MRLNFNRLAGSPSIIFLIAAFLFLYIEVLSTSSIGTAVSFGLFFLLAVVSMVSLKHGIILTWVAAVLIPEYPRDILDVYDALQVTGEVQYNVISSVSVGPGSLILHLFILNTILAMFNYTKIRIGIVKICGLIALFCLGSVGLVYDFIGSQNNIVLNMVITDFKFPLLLLMGLVQGAYLRNVNGLEILGRVILFLPLYFGLREIFFILGDFIHGVPKLDLMTHPLLSTAVFAFLLHGGAEDSYLTLRQRMLLYLSMFNMSRGLMALQGVFLFGTRFLKKIRKNLNAGQRFFEIVLIITALIGAFAVVSPRLFDFFIWKLADINVIFEGADLSGSGQVRQYELMNIVAEMSDPVVFLVGKGFGGSFKYEHYHVPNDVELDLKSYSESELERGVFYHPHSFLSSILLKYGVLGLLLYIGIPFYVAFIQIRSNSSYGRLFGFMAILMIYNYYWRMEYMVLMGILFGASQRLSTGPVPLQNGVARIIRY